jgi:hypothetical protein
VGELPQIPVLVNGSKVKKHTMLIATNDCLLKSVTEQLAKKRSAELIEEKKKVETAKKAKQQTE